MKPKEIGLIGEKIAIKYLIENDFKILLFGKEMAKRGNIKNIATVPDSIVGYSYGNFNPFSRGELRLEWEASNIPNWADLDYGEIKKCARACKNNTKCSIRDADPKSAPCHNINEFLDQKWLSSITPASSIRVPTKQGNLQKPKGHYVVSECLRLITKIALSKHFNNFHKERSFILDNMLISRYIQNYWSIWLTKNPLPYGGSAIRQQDTDIAEKFKEKNRNHLKSFPGYGSHPGRYDFIGWKNGELYAIEIKVNQSDLSYWQKIRLGLLQRYGHHINVIQIRATPDELRSFSNNEIITSLDISETGILDLSKIQLPTHEEFLETANLTFDGFDNITLEDFYKSLEWTEVAVE